MNCAVKGAVEAVFSVLALQHRIAPPTANLEEESPVILGQKLVGKVQRELQGEVKAVMSNSFGFGGTNASLVFTAPPD